MGMWWVPCFLTTDYTDSYSFLYRGYTANQPNNVHLPAWKGESTESNAFDPSA